MYIHIVFIVQDVAVQPKNKPGDQFKQLLASTCVSVYIGL